MAPFHDELRAIAVLPRTRYRKGEKMGDTILTDLAQGVLLVTLNRPDKKNAFKQK